MSRRERRHSGHRRRLAVVAAAAVATAVVGAPPANAAAAAQPPDHIVVVVEENESADAVLGSPQAPYLTSLAGQGISFTDAHAETHPSQPNYMALFSGDQQGVVDDRCVTRFPGPDLGSELIGAGRSFVGYSEDLPHAGYTGCKSGKYAQKHSPWTAFADVPDTANQPWSAWPADYATLPTVAFVTPNLCNDMHDCGIAAGDRWIAANLSDYVGWAATHNSLLIVTWDEADDDSPDNRIPTLIVGAGVPAGENSSRIDHYSLLRSIEDAYGLPRLGRSAAAEPVAGIPTPAGGP